MLRYFPVGSVNGLRFRKKEERNDHERPIMAVSHGWDRSLAGATKFIKEHMEAFIFSSPAVFEPSASFRESFARSVLTHL